MSERPMSEPRSDAGLTEAEREALPFGPDFYPAVERIFADRLAAVQAGANEWRATAFDLEDRAEAAEAEVSALTERLARVWNEAEDAILRANKGWAIALPANPYRATLAPQEARDE